MIKYFDYEVILNVQKLCYTEVAPLPLRVGTRISNALNGSIIFNLFDDALADLFCLRTYTHGTSPKSYNSIIKMGADPTRGGQGGESAFYEAFGESHEEAVHGSGPASGWNCKKRFFVFLDECPEPIKRWQPRIYSIAACIGENCSTEQNKLLKALLIAASIFEGFCSPVLKFRFTPDNPTHFEWDKTFSNTTHIAGFTEQPITPDHIGLPGTLQQGLNAQWGDRIKNNPMQFTKGLLKLIATLSLIAGLIFASLYCPILPTILLIYGTLKGIQILARLIVPLTHQ